MTTHDSGIAPPRPAVNIDLPASMLERITLILDTFEGKASRLTLEEVTRASRLPRSTVHRIVHQMVQLNWISPSPTGYKLGKRALMLGDADEWQAQIRVVVSPLLHELQVQTGMVVHLSILDGSDITYLDKIGGPLAAALPSRVGGNAPAYSTAGGKAMLAWLDPEQVDNVYNNRLERRAPRTISNLATLHLELDRIRQRQGLAFEQDEAMHGIACVGAAIRTFSGPVAGISLCGRTGDPNLERFTPLVMNAALRMSRALALVTRSHP